MRSVYRSWRVLIVWMGLALLPAAASAQSGIAGVVKDTSGAVLPGVTVEAASPALIEQVRTVATDGEGRYSIVDLRPGVYTVTFSLGGFSTVKRQELELQSNITLPINAEMKVGAVEETLTVTGEAPVVDVQSTARTAVMTRDMQDSIPNARNVQSIGAMVPGVKLSTPDVGGSQQMEQTYITSRGNGARDTTIQVDGMMINGLMSDGLIQAYTDNALVEEATYQTSGVSAEVMAGGTRVNMIPKEGGNSFSGAGFVGGSSGDWQSANVTPELQARGFTGQTSIEHVQDVNISMGGPIKRDKVWFFSSYRYQSTNDQIANAFYSDGSPGIQDQYIKSISGRVTWQASPRNKFSSSFSRIWKFKGHEISALQDVGTASLRRDPKPPSLYLLEQTKWTSPVNNKFLLEAGFSTNIERYTNYLQPEVIKERGSPEWYANASRFDRTLGTRKTAGSYSQGQFPDRYVLSGSASYVTGSHSFKTGIQWTWGPFVQTRDTNGDLNQEYLNGVPASVTVYNTPTVSEARLDGDFGIYAQDTWSVNKFTVNLGLRFDHMRGSIPVQDAPAGRFAPARHYEPINCKTMPGLTCWSSFSPRLGLTYDLFGTGRTVLKGSFGRYEQSETTGFVSVYNPMFLTSERRTWKDTNGDDIAQDSEIGASPNASFGSLSGRRLDPNYDRAYNLQYSFQLNHALARNVAFMVGLYRRHARNQPLADNLNYGLDDWTASQTVTPKGETITVYNLNKNVYGRPQDVLDTISPDTNKRSTTYTGAEASFTMRLPRRSTVSVSWSTDHEVDVNCDSPDDPNSFRFCDGRELNIPYHHDIKASGSIQLPYGIAVSGSLLSNSGAALLETWIVTPSTRDLNGKLVIPNMTNSSLSVPLIPYGVKYLERWNQLDLGIRRIFRFGGRKEIHAQVDFFNATNSNAVLSQNNTWGSSLDRPLRIMQPRMLRLATQFKF